MSVAVVLKLIMGLCFAALGIMALAEALLGDHMFYIPTVACFLLAAGLIVDWERDLH